MASTPPARPSDGPPPSANIQTRPRAVQITAQSVQPTLRLYTQDEDVLQFAAIANFNGAQVNFGLRWLMPDGQIIPQIVTLNVPTSGVLSFLQTNCPEGYLLTAAMFAPTSLSNSQWIWASASILRGGIQGANTFDNFLMGYLTHEYSPSFPDWPPQRPSDGAGTIVSTSPGNPAAGADFSVTVPNNRRWQLIAIRGALTASAAVANRFPAIVLDDGANQVFLSRINVATTAGQSNGFTWAPTVQPYTDTQSNFLLPLPSPVFLASGYHVKSSTLNLQAGDQWSNIQLLVSEWVDQL